MTGETVGRFIHKTSGYAWARAKGHPRANRSGYVLEHILVADAVLGYFLEEPHQVHHHNKVRSDNAHTNLVICEDQAYHHLLHARMRILKRGGDPDREKGCSICKRLLSLSAFTTDRDGIGGRSSTCKGCMAKYGSARRRREGCRIRRPNLTEGDDARILAMLDAGLSRDEVAATTRVSRGTINWVKLRRGRDVPAAGSRTQCQHGHSLHVYPNGRKACLLCRAASQRAYMERKRNGSTAVS